MLCRERFTDTHNSDALANSCAFGRRCERQGVCDGSGVYVAQRVVEIIETGVRVKTLFATHVSSPSNGFSKHPLGAGLGAGNLRIIESLTGFSAFRSRIQDQGAGVKAWTIAAATWVPTRRSRAAGIM